MSGRAGRRLVLAALAAGAFAACDDQIKYIPVFSTMSTQPSVEAYEAAPRGRVPGTMAIDDARHLNLFEADSLLTNPTSGTAAELARGQELFGQFCTPCHGQTGVGNGLVVGPNRLPPLPTLNITSDLTRSYSDGYIWGMITNGRGVMPSYRRIPADERWLIVNYVRQLQRNAAGAGGGE
jgi:mono/diheme cytochrome c family protein